MESRRKKIAILDMWASDSTSRGPSKHWLYSQLSRVYDLEVINPLSEWRETLALLFHTFSLNRSRWGSNYYRLKEQVGKTTQIFQKRTNIFQRALSGMKEPPDAILQIGGLFGPVGIPGVPTFSYHDQTVRMVETGWPEWLPDDFSAFRNAWYQLEGELYRGVSRVITYSGTTRDSVINDYGVAAERVTVIPTACKLPYPSPEQVLRVRKRQLLFVTTDFFRKGGDVLLDAFSEVKAVFPDVELIIAGGRIPSSVDIGDSAVKYVGALSPEELTELYLQSALLVHPARHDAFPNVLKEAVACGLPVVGSGSCGIPEILHNGRCGAVVRELNGPAVAAEVVGLLRDAARHKALQEGCLAVRDEYRPEAVGESFIALIADGTPGRNRKNVIAQGLC